MNSVVKESATQVDTPHAFMVRDLARSGLIPSDFPTPPAPFHYSNGRNAYRIQYTADWYKDRIDGDPKYLNCPGKPPPVVLLGEFKGAKITAAVEGYKKALLFHITTGVPTVVLDSCHGWGEAQVDTEELEVVRDIHQEILSALPPVPHLVLMDGDWKSNEQVGNVLTCTQN